MSTADLPLGLIVAAPTSGGGKTTVSLALMRAFRRKGLRVAPAKVGPDYIDPGFHQAACSRPSVNFDPWAMRPASRRELVSVLQRDADMVLIEGVMGLFDGTADGSGSTADVAAETGYPVLLVVDVRGQAASAAAIVRGFAAHRSDFSLAGVLFNRVGSSRHAAMLQQAMAESGLDTPVLGCLPRADDLALESRHLGLVQAQERANLDTVLERAADWIETNADLDAIQRSAGTGYRFDIELKSPPPLPPLGQRIAVARDDVFSFIYPHVLDGWRTAGAELAFFSPLADETPAADADAVYLPGGYPELHAGRLAANTRFLEGLRDAVSGPLFGECGGYMVLGETLTDADGVTHSMAGFLPLKTSFAERKLHLGYRRVEVLASGAPWPKGTALAGHEFHYATTISESGAEPLFRASDATGNDHGPAGLRLGRVCGSFLHLIDRTV